MLNSLVTFFNKTSTSEVLEHNKPLINKESGGQIYRTRGGSKIYSARGETEEEGREIIRVKVLMTKQEANRLLSRCKDGGVLEFKDVARELAQIPVNRVTVFNPPSTRRSGTVLKSISEEF